MLAPLHDWWPRTRVLNDDHGLIVVDKPSGIAVHGGDEGLKDDVVERLRAMFRARGEADYLGVHQRLDKETSGVLLFTRDPQRNADVAQAFESHVAQKKYVAVVALDSRGNQNSLERLGGTWEDNLSRPLNGQVNVVRAGGQHAVTRCRVVEQRGRRALLELSPITGRTHQLRVQASARGVPIVGDRLYDGEPASRLMLHAQELKLPNAPAYFAAMPGVFTECLNQTPFAFGAEELWRRLSDACIRRVPLFGQTEAYRLVNELGDQLPGICVDKYGDFAVLHLFDETATRAQMLLVQLLLRLGFRGVRVEQRGRGMAPVVAAGPSALTVVEHGAKFEIRLGGDTSVGLFLDQRENRQKVRAWSKGARVLNLFCYTGSFSVAAALGGAKKVVSVDLSGNYLDWAKRNFELNGISPERHEFIQADATAWLEQAKRQKLRFDLIVLDPPSFSTAGKRGTFSVARDYQETAAICCALLAPGGQLLAITNHRKTPLSKLRTLLRGAAEVAGRSVVQLKDLRSSSDCPDLPSEPYPSKSVLVRLK